MLPDITYLVRFVKWDGNVELWEHIEKKQAEEQYTACLEDDDMYHIIELIERNWETDTDTVVKRKVFYRASPCCV